jgi:hypothetical protein
MNMEEQPVRFKSLAVACAAVVALGQLAVLGVGGFGLWEGLDYLMGKTCPMGGFGASIYSLMALMFLDPPLLLATALVVWLARRQLPRWVRACLLAGLAVAIVLPLGALACVRHVDSKRATKQPQTQSQMPQTGERTSGRCWSSFFSVWNGGGDHGYDTQMPEVRNGVGHRGGGRALPGLSAGAGAG